MDNRIKKNHRDMTIPFSSIAVSLYIQEAIQAKYQLANFMKNNAKLTTCIPLGENCSSAWYLKQLGLKKESYPFDWVFSSPDIIVDCINDRFKRYLDKNCIVPKKGNISAGHYYYHKSFFHHRNPLASEDDYSYYKRCCRRFTDILESQNTICCIITLINEPSKRIGWAEGFTCHFPLPENQSVETILTLMKRIKNKNNNAKFVIIDHYTNNDSPSISSKNMDNVFWIEFHARGDSTGVYYQEQLDDFCFKLILTGLYGAP